MPGIRKILPISFLFVLCLPLGACGIPTEAATLLPALASSTTADGVPAATAPAPTRETPGPTLEAVVPTPPEIPGTPSPGLIQAAQQTYDMPAPDGALARLGKGQVVGFDLSSSGELLAVASSAGVFVYRAANLEELWREASQTHVVEVAFSPNGETLAAGLDQGVVRLWTAAGGQFLRRLGIPPSPQDSPGPGLTRLAYSPDGGVLAAGTKSGSILLWDPKRGEALPTLEETDESEVGHLVFTPDGQVLISAARAGSTITFWDPSIAQKSGQVKVVQEGILDLAVAPDGARLAVLAGPAGQETITIWDLAALPGSGRLLPGPVLTLDAGSAHSLAFSPDSQALAVGARSEIVFWSTKDGEALGKLAISTGLDPVFARQMSFTPAGTALFGLLSNGTENGPVSVWELPSGEVLRILEGFTLLARRVEISGNGQRLAAGFGHLQGAGTVWEFDSTEPGLSFLGSFPLSAGGDQAGITSLAFTTQGDRLAVGGEDGLITVFNLPPGEPGLPFRLEGPDALPVLDLAFSPAGDLLAAAYQKEEDSILLWDLAEEKHPLRLPAFNTYSLAFSPGGELLAAGAGQRGSVTLWDPAGGKQELMLFGPSTGILWVGFTSTGEELAAVFNNGQELWWSAPDGITLGSFDFEPIFPATVFLCAAASPDGSILAVGTEDGEVVLLDREAGEILRRLEGHSGSILDLVFSPDGDWLASGSADGTVIVWGLNSDR